MTAIFFAIGKWAFGLYLGSVSAASAYGAASSLITLLLWVYYSSQILSAALNLLKSTLAELAAVLCPMNTPFVSRRKK